MNLQIANILYFEHPKDPKSCITIVLDKKFNLRVRRKLDEEDLDTTFCMWNNDKGIHVNLPSIKSTWLSETESWANILKGNYDIETDDSWLICYKLHPWTAEKLQQEVHYI